MELDRSLGVFFLNGVRVTRAHPRQAWQFLRTVRHQAAAAKVRRAWLRQGLKVPPIIIFSITNQCNLQCAGCYAQAFHAAAPVADPTAAAGVTAAGVTAAAARAGAPAASGSAPAAGTPELSSARLAGIVDEAAALGVSFFVIAGGEPLMRPEILDIAGHHPDILFLLLTNGLLLDRPAIARLAGLRNLVPLLSLEGTAAQTDGRRGPGTHQHALEVMRQLRETRTFFGCSITLTSENYSTVLEEEYVGDLVRTGCGFFLFLDYTPADATTEDWVLSDEQHAAVTARMAALRKRHRALFVAVPWDEQEVGGCLSAGRGFVHISASGDLEPCPFAPCSDANLNDESLAQALRSPFLRALRELPELSGYSGGGCALWKHREEVERVLHRIK